MQADGVFCRVCLNPLKNFFLQENTDIQIRNLQFCVPQLDLTATTDFFLCHTCQYSLNNLYYFKINCLQTEEKLKSHLKSNLLEKNDIKKALQNISHSEPLDGFLICRTCLQLTENVCYINETYFEVIEACIPEPNPVFFVNTVICRPCETKFRRMLHFRNQCFSSEELINEFKKTVNKDKINLTDLIKWKQNIVCIKKEVDDMNYEMDQPDYVSLSDINNQQKDVENLCIKSEPEIYIKHECVDIGVEDIQEEIEDVVNIKKEVDNDINYEIDQSDYVSFNSNNQLKDIENVFIKNESEVHIKHECIDIKVEDIEEEIEDENQSGYHHSSKLLEKYETSSNTFWQATNEDGEKLYDCQHCSYQTKWKAHLKRHSQIHSRDVPREEKNYKCKSCTFVTRYKHALSKHLTLEHRPWLKCDQCDFQTKWIRCFNAHTNSHRGDLWLKCNSCDYVTKWKHHLKRHMFVHQSK